MHLFKAFKKWIMKIFHFDTIRCIFKVLLWWLLWFVSDDSDSESNSISNAFIATFLWFMMKSFAKRSPVCCKIICLALEVQMALFRRIAIWEGGGRRGGSSSYEILDFTMTFQYSIERLYWMMPIMILFVCKNYADSTIESFIAIKLSKIESSIDLSWNAFGISILKQICHFYSTKTFLMTAGQMLILKFACS